jgi:integrase/recombinase XerD
MNRAIAPYSGNDFRKSDQPAIVIDGEVVKVEPSPLTIEDYHALRQAMVVGKPADARNVLICRALYATGLRIAELMRLTPAHVLQDGPDTVVLVKRGKKRRASDQWERVPLNPDVGVALRQFIAGNQIQPGDRVFNISDRQVRNVFRDAGLRSIGRPVHPHQLRALYVKSLMEGGLPAEVAAAMVGHADYRTTQRHYFALTERQRHEINRGLPA